MDRNEVLLIAFLGAIEAEDQEGAEEYHSLLSASVAKTGYFPACSSEELALFHSFGEREEIADERDADDWNRHSE